jgi:hypothetical protein
MDASEVIARELSFIDSSRQNTEQRIAYHQEELKRARTALIDLHKKEENLRWALRILEITADEVSDG